MSKPSAICALAVTIVAELLALRAGNAPLCLKLCSAALDYLQSSSGVRHYCSANLNRRVALNLDALHDTAGVLWGILLFLPRFFSTFRNLGLSQTHVAVMPR